MQSLALTFEAYHESDSSRGKQVYEEALMTNFKMHEKIYFHTPLDIYIAPN